MKKIFLTLVLLSLLYNVNATGKVTVRISDGIENTTVKSKMEQVISKILTEANAAHKEKRELNYSILGIPSSVQGSLASLWDNSPFISLDNEIVERCITTANGYQIRNIPLILKPLNSTDIEDDEDYQEAVVSFDKQGNLYDPNNLPEEMNEVYKNKMLMQYKFFTNN